MQWYSSCIFLKYRLPKYISRREMQMTKVMTGEKRSIYNIHDTGLDKQKFSAKKL